MCRRLPGDGGRGEHDRARGTSRTTVALAPMRASSPTVIGPMTTAPAPMLTRSPITG
jgi:hypothetical protein